MMNTDALRVGGPSGTLSPFNGLRLHGLGALLVSSRRSSSSHFLKKDLGIVDQHQVGSVRMLSVYLLGLVTCHFERKDTVEEVADSLDVLLHTLHVHVNRP